MARVQLVAACILSLCSGIAIPADNEQRQEVGQLRPSNAESDAARSLSRGDRRLLAVYGYTVEIPGIDGDQRETTEIRDTVV